MESGQASSDSFTHMLVGDVVAAHARVREAESQMHRRELICTVFAAIEGLHWQLKQDVLRQAKSSVELSAHEYAALSEEGYVVDDRGNVRTQPRFLPLPTAIRRSA